jgi:hypothetical protein
VSSAFWAVWSTLLVPLPAVPGPHPRREIGVHPWAIVDTNIELAGRLGLVCMAEGMATMELAASPNNIEFGNALPMVTRGVTSNWL